MARTKNGSIINEYKPVNRGDYGVRVARFGYDASTCTDSNLLFNSGWRIIQIVRVISEKDKRVHIDQSNIVQPNWILQSEETQGVWNWDCAVDDQWLYLPKINRTYWNPTERKTVGVAIQYKIYHGLGYVPMFFKSEFVSDKPGYFLMTNVNIRQDADYPYTSAPSEYLGGTSDYGIKSKSFTRAEIPAPGETRGCGINTSIQSKMVMAIKTEQTKPTEKGNPDPITGNLQNPPYPAWGVPKDDNAQTTKISDYEPFGYFAYADDGGHIFTEYPVGTALKDGDFYTLIDQWGAAVVDARKSLVILRSPLVAPEYEEFTI